MRSTASALVPVFRSPTQGRILAVLLLSPPREWTIGELARNIGRAQSTVYDEVERLAAAAVLTTRKLGQARLVSVNPDHPAIAALSDLARLMYGPAVVVGEEFAGLPADAVVIFGSWAARDAGVAGPPPGDVDVLVLADGLSRDVVYAAADRAAARLNLGVNPVVRPAGAWEDPRDPLIAEIRSRPFVVAVGRR